MDLLVKIKKVGAEYVITTPLKVKKFPSFSYWYETTEIKDFTRLCLIVNGINYFIN